MSGPQTISTAIFVSFCVSLYLNMFVCLFVFQNLFVSVFVFKQVYLFTSEFVFFQSLATNRQYSRGFF